jgi:CRISPR-associated protein Cmr4
MNARLLFTHALSPLHAGTGQGVGVIDLPIAREKATGIPYLPGSSLKGTLRDLCKDERKEKVFGPKNDKADEHAGAAQFADQRLLLLPIRSLAGTFAWVTSPYLLKRFLRDASDAGVADISSLSSPSVDGEKCLVVKPYQINNQQVGCKLGLKVDGKDKVVLEDLDLMLTEDTQASKWAEVIGEYVFDDADWKKILGERFCIVSDDVLSFLLDTATEITARIKLQEDYKTVQQGGLWYEEALPTETILYGFVLATLTGHHKNNGLNEAAIFDIVEKSIEPVVQLGGKATVGRGLCRLSFQGAKPKAIQTQPVSYPPHTTASPMPQPSSDKATPDISSTEEKEASTQMPTLPQSSTSKPVIKPLVKKPQA